MINPISIVSISSISALGHTPDVVLQNYLSNNSKINSGPLDTLVAQLPDDSKNVIEELKNANQKYSDLDQTVLYGIHVSRMAINNAEWSSKKFGINIGSSRGATALFEKYHQNFLENKRIAPLTSPTTTLGNISSWVAQDLQVSGPNISHSITCSTSLHAFLNGIAWVNSGMCDKFLVGGSEASLTKFTIAQMKALKIYANKNTEFPCRSLDIKKTENTMVLGEGAASACLEKGETINAMAIIESVGYATELLTHGASLSAEAICFQKSMKMALDGMSTEQIDVIITHTPGTIKGDKAELIAINNVFGKCLPALTCNKWKIGHTLGASGILSVEMAIIMIQSKTFFPVPFIDYTPPKHINRVMINSVGFGGNAVSIVIKHPNC